MNAEWIAGDLRNSQSIAHFGNADQNLLLENQILLQQLEESKQKIILTKRRADRDIQQVNSRIEETERTLQDFLRSHQQAMQQSVTALEKTQSQLRETESQLQQANTRALEMQQQIQVIIIIHVDVIIFQHSSDVHSSHWLIIN